MTKVVHVGAVHEDVIFAKIGSELQNSIQIAVFVCDGCLLDQAAIEENSFADKWHVPDAPDWYKSLFSKLCKYAGWSVSKLDLQSVSLDDVQVVLGSLVEAFIADSGPDVAPSRFLSDHDRRDDGPVLLDQQLERVAVVKMSGRVDSEQVLAVGSFAFLPILKCKVSNQVTKDSNTPWLS